MSTQVANEKKRHHYIPITYLNKFTDNSGKVFAFRKDDVDAPLHLQPSAIAYERYYYSQPLPEVGRDNNTLENHFSTVESTWNALYDRLRLSTAAANDFAVSDFEGLFIFMGLMRVRVPAARDMVEISLSERVKTEVRLLDDLGKLPPKPEGHEDILDHLSVPIDPHMSLHAMGQLMKGFGFILDHLGYEVIHNETDVTFLTSDNPIVYFDPTVSEARVLPYQVRPPHGSIELIFPIDPNTILLGHTRLRRPRPPRLHHTVLHDRQAAKRINRFVARFGYRLVFSPDRTHEVLIAKHASTSPVIRSISVQHPNGGYFLLNDCVFGPRPTKPKWKTDD
jgi:hypothetical protein